MAALIEQKSANRHESPVRDIFEQTARFNNAVVIKYINILCTTQNITSKKHYMVSGQLPPRKIAPLRLALRFGLGLVLGLGAIFPGGNCSATHYI